MACWELSEGTGSTVNDGSGNNNNGTMTGATWVQTDAGTALNFTNAGNQTVSVADSNSLTSANAITLEAWVRPTAIGGDGTTDRIIDKQYNGEYGFGFAFGQLCAKLDNNDYCNGSPVTNVWQHVGVTWATGGPVRLWINGLNIGSSMNRGGSMPNGIENLTLGDSTTASNSSTRYQGDLNRVRIYSRAKSPAEMCTAAGRVWSGTACM